MAAIPYEKGDQTTTDLFVSDTTGTMFMPYNIETTASTASYSMNQAVDRKPNRAERRALEKQMRRALKKLGKNIKWKKVTSP